jgi:molybdopterin converting factor small subunit
MPVTVHLSGHLKAFSAGELEIALPGDYQTVGDVLDSLWRHHLALRDRILTEQGEIRQHVNIYLGNKDIRRLDGLFTPMTSSEVHIFNAVSGG